MCALVQKERRLREVMQTKEREKREKRAWQVMCVHVEERAEEERKEDF